MPERSERRTAKGTQHGRPPRVHRVVVIRNGKFVRRKKKDAAQRAAG